MALLLILTAFIAIAVGFAIWLVKRDKGESEPVGALWAAFGFGLLGTAIAMALELQLIPNIDEIIGAELGTVLYASIGIGVIEELAKALPLMAFIYHKRYFNEHTDGVIYFAIAGLGFGLPENLLYTLQYGAGTGLGRIIMTPLFHSAMTAIIGYALARRKLGDITTVKVIWTIVLACAIHSLYDFGLFSGIPGLSLLSVIVTVGLTVSLFLLYGRARALDQAKGLSVVGNNAFCRSCGWPNPKRKLYCSHCGNHA